MIFPSNGVRFIAVNNNVDRLYGKNDFTPFVNLFNDFHAKDTSRKIRAVVKAKAERSERVGTRPPYGYRKKGGDPQRELVPDEETALVVQRIFALCAGGKGPSQIARQLREEQVLTPGNYYYRKIGVLLTGVDAARPYDWSGKTLARMLENEVYLGHTVNLRFPTMSYKNKKRIERPESEHLRFENTHEPLVTKETWDIVQDRPEAQTPPGEHGGAESVLRAGLLCCLRRDDGAPPGAHHGHRQKQLHVPPLQEARQSSLLQPLHPRMPACGNCAG